MVVVAFFFFSFFISTRAFSRIVISGRKLGKVKERNEIKLKSLSLRKLLMFQASLLTVKMGHYSTVQPVLSITGVLIVLHM